MENNFNNETMNDGIETGRTFENHKSMTNGQIASAIIICSIIAAGVIKGADWLKKRKQAKMQAEFVDGVETEEIETTEEE